MEERVKILKALPEVGVTVGLKELAEKADLSIGKTLGYLGGALKGRLCREKRETILDNFRGKKRP